MKYNKKNIYLHDTHMYDVREFFLKGVKNSRRMGYIHIYVLYYGDEKNVCRGVGRTA